MLTFDELFTEGGAEDRRLNLDTLNMFREHGIWFVIVSRKKRQLTVYCSKWNEGGPPIPFKYITYQRLAPNRRCIEFTMCAEDEIAYYDKSVRFPQ
jgi:hypothetical protein